MYESTLSYLDFGIRRSPSFRGCSGKKEGRLKNQLRRVSFEEELARTETHLQTTFSGSPIIYGASNDVPSTVDIGEVSSISRRCGTHSELKRERRQSELATLLHIRFEVQDSTSSPIPFHKPSFSVSTLRNSP